MAKVVTVSIGTAAAAKALAGYANGATVVLTGSGGDRWATAGSGGETVERSFTVTVESCPPEGGEV